MTQDHSYKAGSLLVVMITGMTRIYIAEIIVENPLVIKVEETGVLSKLKEEDFIIMENESAMAQGSDEDCNRLLSEALATGYPLLSGLYSLGVASGKAHEILPVSEVETV